MDKTRILDRIPATDVCLMTDFLSGRGVESNSDRIAFLLGEDLASDLWDFSYGVRNKLPPFLRAYLRAMFWLRDEKGVVLDAETLSEHAGLDAIRNLASPEAYPDMPANIRAALQAYLKEELFLSEKFSPEVAAIFGKFQKPIAAAAREAWNTLLCAPSTAIQR